MGHEGYALEAARAKARQQLATLLDIARREGNVQIRRRDGQLFVLQPAPTSGSPVGRAGNQSQASVWRAGGDCSRGSSERGSLLERAPSDTHSADDTAEETRLRGWRDPIASGAYRRRPRQSMVLSPRPPFVMHCENECGHCESTSNAYGVRNPRAAAAACIAATHRRPRSTRWSPCWASTSGR